MGSFPSKNPSLPTSIPGIYEPPSSVVGVVPIASGGTGQITAPAALAALGGVGQHAYKLGSNGGNYVISGTSFAAIDDTALKVTITVPVGAVAFALLLGSVAQVIGGAGVIGIAVDGAVGNYIVIGGAVSNGQDLPFSVMAFLVGDGASHTFSPQAFVTNASDTLTILNGSGGPPNNGPQFAVLSFPAT